MKMYHSTNIPPSTDENIYEDIYQSPKELHVIKNNDNRRCLLVSSLTQNPRLIML